MKPESSQSNREELSPRERTQVGSDMVCVTLQRPPHFWRFACPSFGTSDLLERLAEMADNPNNPMTWEDAELIASEILVHHHLDHPSAG